jgi:hypothetical protein
MATSPIPFPMTLPANTVVGRLSVGTGPAEAIPLSTISSSGGGVPWFNVKTYGAKGDGATDDTAAINAAIAALNAATNGGVLYFPASTYLVTSATTTITKPFLMQGDGISCSFISCNTSVIAFSCQNGQGTVKNMQFNFTGTPPAGSGSRGFQVTSTGGAQQTVNFETCWFDSFYIGLDFQAGQSCCVTNTHFYRHVNAALNFHNTFGVDIGDFCVSNCEFHTNVTTGAGITITVGGGKIINSKFNAFGGGSLNPCVNATLTGTADLLISNCSMENCASGIVVFGGIGGVDNFGNVLISNIEFQNVGGGGNKAISLDTVYRACIDNIVFDTIGTFSFCIWLNAVGNVFIGQYAVGGTTSPTILSFNGGAGASIQAGGTFAANGAVATAFSGVGPTGSRTSIQKWLTVLDTTGNPFYIPCF